MKRVLVVEDEASIREMVALNLKMAGWEVLEAPSAERALELMHQSEPCDAALLETIVNMAPEKVVYVSCDPATLARDLKILCENGYELKRVRAVDQFPMTVHVETICKFTRNFTL